MRRTYRSKKDTGGALDHRDVLQNMDEKSSAFEAFYIQNIKQTKRELSCVGSSNAYGVASKKVRKIKYVKRIVKEVENVQPMESMSTSTYLTPDKSIRVNKILDPFDALLNSSSTAQMPAATKNDKPKKEGQTYTRKRLTKVKKINYSSDNFSDSDKENTSNAQINMTDIRTHKLLVEGEPRNSPKYLDESINKIVNNLSLINNFKQKNSSFNTSYKHRNKLLRNCQSPILQKSPLCSTPFKDKYRGKSIYNFSPISTKQSESPNYMTIAEENNESNNSIVFICKEKVYKLSNKHTSPSTPVEESTHAGKLHNESLIYEDEIDVQIDECETKQNEQSNDKNSKSLSNEKSLCQITEVEPFLGFSDSNVNESIINQKNYLLQKIQENLEDKNINENHLKSLDITVKDLNIDETKNNSAVERSLDNFTMENASPKESINKSDRNKSLETSSEQDVNLSKNESDERYTSSEDSDEDFYPSDESDSINHDDDNDESARNPETSIKSKETTMCDSINSSQVSDKESMYDTCESESCDDENKDVMIKEPKVAIERLNDSIFIKYYEKMLVDKEDSSSSNSNISLTNESLSENDVTTSDTNDTQSEASSQNEFKEHLTEVNEGNKGYDKFASDNFNDASQTNISSTSKMTDYVKTKTMEITISDSSTTEDVESCDELTNANEDERHVSFVTTRRRNEIKNDSMFLFDNSYGSSSTDCDKTVLSNKARLSYFEKSHVEIDDSINKTRNSDTFENCEDTQYDEDRTDKHRNTTSRQSGFTRQRESIDMEASINEVTIIGTEQNDCDETINIEPPKQTINKESRSSVTTSRKSGFTRQRDSIDMEASIDEVTIIGTDQNDCDETINIEPPKQTINKESRSSVTTSMKSGFTRQRDSIDMEASIDEVTIIGTDQNDCDETINIEPPKQTINKESRSSVTTSRKSGFTRQRDSIDMEASIDEVTIIGTDQNDCDLTINNVPPKQTINKESRSSVTTRKSSRMLRDSSISDRTDAEVKPSIVLQPGKKWERSLSIYRRMTTMADHFDQSLLEYDAQKKGRKYRQSVISTMELQDSLHNESINSRRSTFISKPSRPTIRLVKDSNSSRISLNTSEVFDDLKGFLTEECDDTVIELSKLSLADLEFEVTVLDNFHESSDRIATARDYVLRRCNQTDPILFDECYPETVLKNCHKIGEGVYGEVFLWRGRDGRARVMKIVPIAGSCKVNGEDQKDFHEVISEIVIAMELSALRAPIADIDRCFDEGKDLAALDLHAVENATDVFNEVLAVRCVQGPYPSRLLDLWELYDECKGSENDNPALLPADQQYMVLELANAGQDLESYQFTGAQQAHALFQQIAFGLAVGEESFQFEHRDLHWGNVLIAPTEQKLATFVLRGRTYRVPRGGVAATIIDYSLSRISLPLAAEQASLYNDLATDEQLFEAVGDYQFQVYRLMRDKLGNDWKNFEPYTNILWLHYTVDKMITALRYKRTNTKIHKHYIEKLTGIKERILDFKSATEYVLTDIEI